MKFEFNKKYTLDQMLIKIGGEQIDTCNDTFPDNFKYNYNTTGLEYREIIKKSNHANILSYFVTELEIYKGTGSITYYKIKISSDYGPENENHNMTLIDLLKVSSRSCYFSTCDAACLPKELKHAYYSRNDLLADLYVNPEYKKFLDYEVYNITTALAISKERTNNPVICFNLKDRTEQM